MEDCKLKFEVSFSMLLLHQGSVMPVQKSLLIYSTFPCKVISFRMTRPLRLWNGLNAIEEAAQKLAMGRGLTGEPDILLKEETWTKSSKISST